MNRARHKVAQGELPSMATALASHVRVAGTSGAAVLDTLPSISTTSPSKVRVADVAPLAAARGSGTPLSGAWLLNVEPDASSDATRANRLSDMVLQRARQGRRFA